MVVSAFASASPAGGGEMSVRERSDVGLPRHAALVGGAGQPPAVNGGLGEPIFWL
jgi:hypothetical protein